MWLFPLLLSLTAFADPCQGLLEQQIPGSFRKEAELLKSGVLQHRIYRVNAAGTTIASVAYSVSDSSLHLSWLETAEAYRGRGVSRLLFGEMLQDNPVVRTIDSTLMLSNIDAIGDADGLSCEELAAQTPSYKIRAFFGFLEITDCLYIKDFALFLTVSSRKQQ